VFNLPRFISNSFSIVFPRQSTIRRKAVDFEDKLKGQYFQPQIISIPDELDPEVPRIIFGSEHGYSQILISQVSIILNVNYSPDFQADIEKGKKYLNERVSTLFDLLELFSDVHPHFCGLATKVRLLCTGDDEAILKHVAKYFLKDEDVSGLYDLQVKRAMIESDRFFSNMTISNYRAWKMDGNPQDILSLPANLASEKGIEILGDFNDRHSFNESKDYHSSRQNAYAIIEGGLNEIVKTVTLVRG